MRLRPCIDIHDGKVKQIVGATLKDGGSRDAAPSQNFVSTKDADWYARVYKEKNLPGGHVILLNKAGTGEYEEDKEQALKALGAFKKGMQAGGGITPETAPEFLDAGASHVIVTSYVFTDGNLNMDRLEKLLSAVGRKHLVLDLSCKRTQDSDEIESAGALGKDSAASYVVVTNRWQKETSLKVTEKTLDFLSSYCDEFLIHAADVEGKRNGIEEPLVGILGRWQKKTGFPITYAGGVHSLEDVRKIKDISGGFLDVTVGSALDLFGGSLSLDELAQACR